MPGPKGNRTKGNVKPSSSSRAAELLNQSGSASAGFIGFGGSSGTAAYVPASQAFDDVDTCLDSQFRVVLRKLTKRDATTKIKALGEFSELCKEKDDNTLLAVLPFWPRLYNKMAIDSDQKVRECAQNTMAILVSRVRRNLAPYLKNVMGAWILSRNDTYPTVASAANKSFSAAFPPDKQENAIVFCKQAVLEYMIDNLLNQTASTLSDPKTTEKEEMEAKLIRVQCSSLMGLRQLLLTLPSAQLDDELKGQLRGLLNEGKFWNLSKSPHPLVRSGQYWFLGSLCQVMPDDVALGYVQKISPLVLGSIDVLEPGLTEAIWNAVLSLVKFIPACWEKVNWQKAFWPKLRKLLESGCQGNASTVAPNILPLLSCIPIETAGGAAVFFPKVLEHMKIGFGQECVANSPSENAAWARAFMECLQFSFRQIGSDTSSSLDVLQNILLDQLVPLLEASLLNSKPTLSRSHLYPAVSTFFHTVESKTETSSLAAVFWSQISDDLLGMFENVGSEGDHSLRPDRLVSFIKALLHPQDSLKPNSSIKGERVKFAAEAENQLQTRVPVLREVKISGAMKTFVKTMVVHSHKLYQEDRSCTHFKLFVDLANLYFPADIADFMLQSLENDTKTGSGGRIGESGEGEGSTDAHSNVIDRVVLPVLGGKEEGENAAEIVDHTITLLFSCLPYLSQQKSTDVWDNVLQTVSSTNALCSLIERALEKRQIMPQVSQWLSSPALHSRLCDLVTMVTTQHSMMPSSELEQGWKVICLVLSANDDNEPVFPSGWIVDVVSSVHKELITLASRTLAPEEAQVAIQFVARAALTFFENLKMSLCLSEGRDVIVALMMADLDCNFSSSGEAGNMLRQSWTAGLGLAVRDTGGLIQEGGMLSSACHIVRDTLLTKTRTMEQFRRVVDVTKELLKMAQSHLPQGDTEDGEAYNPVLVAMLSELLVPPCTTFTYSSKIVQFLCLTGQLPLTKLEYLSDEGEDHFTIMTRLVFSSLFNMGLLKHYRSQFRFDDIQSADTISDGSSLNPWEKEKEVILDAARSILLANTWLRVEHQVSPSVVCAVEELTKATHICFTSSSRSLQHEIIDSACARMSEDVLSPLTVGQLAQLLSALDSDTATYFQQFYSEKIDSLESGEEVLVQFLPLWKMLEIFSVQAAVLTSITADTLPTAVSCLHVMGACMVKDSHAIVSEHKELLQTCVNNLKTLRDEHSALFLFSCDISEVPLWQVAFNISSMQLLTAVVKADPCILTPDFWDFILCSTVSWIESLDNSNTSLSSSTSVQTFCVEACQLLAAVAHTIQKLLPENQDAYPPNLESEWKEFFAEGIYSFLFPLFIRLLDERTESKNGEAEVILGAVGSAMSQCPQDRVVGHNLSLKLLASDHDSPLPDSIQTLLNCLCPALICPLAPAQVTAYSLLEKIMPLLPTYHKGKEAVEASSAAETEFRQEPPPAMLMKVIEDCAAAMDHVLSNIAMGTTVTMAPGTEEYQFALGYLLAWQLMLHLFHSAGSKGRAEYASYLRDHSVMQRLLTHLFALMPASPFLGSSPVKSPGGIAGSPYKSMKSEPVGCQFLFETSVMMLSAADVGCSEDIQRMSCCVYLHCLEVVPVLVRQWWKNQDRKSSAFVDKFTTRHVSPQLIKSEMQSVNSSESAIPDLIVKANHITRQVTASYTTEELKAEIQITLPESYPLGEISVESQRHAVVKQAQWERMLLQLNIFLQHQNGTIMEGLRLWKRNIDKRIEGVEECFICYAVIHASNYELPMVPCKTCKKKFHKACLYKWLNSSQNATCPLCRSIF